MRVGDKYYFLAHAYHHVCGEVVQILGPRSCKLRNAVLVHSCGRSWTEFFADGFEDDTSFDVIPDGTEVQGAFIVVPFAHPIPTAKRGQRRGR